MLNSPHPPTPSPLHGEGAIKTDYGAAGDAGELPARPYGAGSGGDGKPKASSIAGFGTMAWYEARVAFGLTALLPALLLPGYALLGLIIWSSRGVPQMAEINTVVQLALPLVAGLIGSHLLSIEREVGFDPLRRSYAEPFWRLPLWRIGGAVVLVLVSVLVTTLILEIATRGEFAPDQAIVPMLAPSLYLLGLAMLINNLSGNYWVAGMAVVGYWFIEYQSKGAYTGNLFLFRAAIPGAADYDLNQALLFITGMLWLCATVFYSGWRRKRGW